MIVHVISEPKKTVFLDWLGVQKRHRPFHHLQPLATNGS